MTRLDFEGGFLKYVNIKVDVKSVLRVGSVNSELKI